MKRHLALRTLSSDHHHGLVHARRLAHAGDGKSDQGAVIRAYLEFAGQGLARHFREEEEVLLPEFALAVGSDNPLIERVLREHTAIRAQTLRLASARTNGGQIGGLLTDLGRALEAHIRFEERQLLPVIEHTLGQERLAAVGVLLAAGLP